MLDFEKDYDHVDWDFLQGTFARFGFSQECITLFPRYITNHKVKFYWQEVMALFFTISQLVRQACPLAPFLFLLFAEAMITCFTIDDIGVHRLHIPFLDSKLREVEFFDDITLYLLIES